jgi:hypothetical protein
MARPFSKHGSSIRTLSKSLGPQFAGPTMFLAPERCLWQMATIERDAVLIRRSLTGKDSLLIGMNRLAIDVNCWPTNIFRELKDMHHAAIHACRAEICACRQTIRICYATIRVCRWSIHACR